MKHPMPALRTSRIALVVAMTMVAGCHSRKEACLAAFDLTAMLAEATELSAVEELEPYRVERSNVARTESGIPYVANDDPEVFLRVVEYADSTDNSLEDTFARGMRVSADFPTTDWDRLVFSVNNWLGPGAIDCEEATDSELRYLAFFAVNGGDIWTPGQDIVHLVLDEEQRYVVRVTFGPSAILDYREVYTAELRRQLEDGLILYRVIHESREEPLRMVMSTLQLQGL